MKGSIWKQGDKNLRLTEWDIPSVSRFSLSVAVCVVMPKSRNSNQQKKCWKIQPFQKKKLDFLELLGGFEPPTSSLPTAMAIFFVYFSLVYSRFCSISFAFRHSLQTGFPYIPRLSVAGYVVRNPCGTWVFSPKATLFQAKKVVKFESGRLKPSVNSKEISSDKLHLRQQ